MITIYHNPACGTSVKALALLNEKGLHPTVRNVVEDPLSSEELFHLLDLLGMDAMDLVRTNHPVWMAEFSSLELDDEEEIVLALIDNPGMMQRPIVEKDGRAILARPSEKVLEILA